VVAGSSLPYNLAHAIGNVVFCLLIGPAFIRALARYRRRLEVRWTGAPARAAATMLLCCAGLLLAPAVAAAATPSERAERYLLRAQNADGGFGAARGQSSSPLYSGWTGLGLAAADHNPRDVSRRGGRSLAAYVRRGGRGLRDIGEIERNVLVLRASGLDPRRVAGRDLVAEIERRRRTEGSIAGFVSYTAFGVLALRSAGESAGGATVRWLLASQNADGGFGVARSSSSDSDMTGAVLQALATVGRAKSPAARRAVEYLRANQGADGGFAQMSGRSANAQSTAYAVQGLVAVRAARGAVSRALGYLVRLQRPDGSIAYSSSSSQTPVWVTAQALAALRREPLPIGAVQREARSSPAKETPRGSTTSKEGSTTAGGGQDPPESSDTGAARRPTAERSSPPSPATAPVRTTPAGPEPGVAGPAARSALLEGDQGGHLPIWLVIGALALTLGVVLMLRRRLGRRRFAARSTTD
jgi:prenyltransferase beta subunit